jgi:hypothetical protein
MTIDDMMSIAVFCSYIYMMILTIPSSRVVYEEMYVLLFGVVERVYTPIIYIFRYVYLFFAF